MLIGMNWKAVTQALVDSGATEIFMYPHFVEMYQIRMQKTPVPIPVNIVQNTKLKGGSIIKFA